METIGQRIRRRREDKQWTLPKLSEVAGVAKGYLWELEADKAARPSAASLFKIATALGTSIADLLGEEVREEVVDVPESLRRFAEKHQLSQEDVKMLSGIHYRGARPKDEDDWNYLLESIRRSVRRRPSETFHHSRGRASWSSPEAEELVRVSGISDPIEAIKARVGDLLNRGEQDGPPVHLELLASLQGVARIERIAMREAGRLIPSSNGLIIQVNEDSGEGRSNFTIAHEIGHTLMPSYSRKPASRTERTIGSYPRNNEEEYLCDIAASALLFPEQWFRPRAIELGPNLEAVLQLSEEFEASLEATALAWTQLHIWPVAIVLWEKSLKPSERRQLQQPSLLDLGSSGPVPKFRVSRFFRSEAFSQFLPIHKSVEDDSVVGRASLVSSSRGPLLIQLEDKVFMSDCEAIAAPYKTKSGLVDRVISLVRPM